MRIYRPFHACYTSCLSYQSDIITLIYSEWYAILLILGKNWEFCGSESKYCAFFSCLSQLRRNLHSWTSPASIFHYENWDIRFLQNLDSDVNKKSNNWSPTSNTRQPTCDLWYKNWFLSLSPSAFPYHFHWCPGALLRSSLIATALLIRGKEARTPLSSSPAFNKFKPCSSLPLHSDRPRYILRVRFINNMTWGSDKQRINAYITVP
jgi:hypothetical protein